MKLIVGLGNPGKKYERTRHNVGFRVVDRLAQRWQIDMQAEKFHAWFGDGVIRGEKAVLLKPTTFMNRSGQAVLAAGRFYRLELSDLLVVYDDVALDLGRLRIRMKGSAGGHNGLQDVITRVGDNAVTRLRLGIGKPLGGQTSYVLSRFAEEEEPEVTAMVERASDAVETWLSDGPEKAMNVFNLPAADPGSEEPSDAEDRPRRGPQDDRER